MLSPFNCYQLHTNTLFVFHFLHWLSSGKHSFGLLLLPVWMPSHFFFGKAVRCFTENYHMLSKFLQSLVYTSRMKKKCKLLKLMACKKSEFMLVRKYQYKIDASKYSWRKKIKKIKLNCLTVIFLVSWTLLWENLNNCIIFVWIRAIHKWGEIICLDMEVPWIPSFNNYSWNSTKTFDVLKWQNSNRKINHAKSVLTYRGWRLRLSSGVS